MAATAENRAESYPKRLWLCCALTVGMLTAVLPTARAASLARRNPPADALDSSSPISDRPVSDRLSTQHNRSARPSAVAGYPSNIHLRSDRPHPAVVRVIVPEAGATSYGSGTLVDVRDQFGLVITNWHVVRDANGAVEVLFPDGFRSKARALKVDADWDLAALVIWRPTVPPVELAATAPRPGDQLTICGYGRGVYRAATGRCTQYYAPRQDFPQHMVELDVEARQGDSGGPIFNRQGKLAGVLFGAGQGTTLGSFGGRVESFLATLAPDIGQRADDLLVQNQPCPSCLPASQSQPPRQLNASHDFQSDHPNDDWRPAQRDISKLWTEAAIATNNRANSRPSAEPSAAEGEPITWREIAGAGWFEQTKTLLAAVGLLAVALQVLRAVR